MSAFHVKIAHSGELFSASSVKDFQDALCTIHFDLFTIRIFNSWIILFNKDGLNKLYSLENILDVYATRTRGFIYGLMIDTQHARIQYIIKYCLYDKEQCILTNADLPTPPEPRTTSLYSRIVVSVV